MQSAKTFICKRRLAFAGVVALAFLLAQSNRPAYGQVVFGSMVGNVTDASGGAVPGAAVKITLTTTNDTRSVLTDSAGGYTISTVTPGTYRVEIGKEGFSVFAASDILVNQNNVVRVDAHLQVGALTQKVEVTTTAAAELQTERADVHAEISSGALLDLPQPNRTYGGLLELVPGTTPPGGQLAGGTNNPSKSMSFSFNGAGTAAETVRVEGVNTQESRSGGGGNQSYVPSVEAIENVNVATNATDAEQVISAGATVNVMLKGGTNETHGGGYDYNIVSRFEANNFFSPYSKPPALVDNDTGGFLGGHIIRNKLFYFGSYEGDFNHSANSGILSIPNAVQLSGNMSGSGNPIYDPNTGNPDGTGRTPFPGNIIPQDRISPIAQKIIPNIPATNIGGPGAVVNNYYVNDRNLYNLHKIDTKLDYIVTSKLRLSGRFAYQPYYNTQQPIYGEILGGASAFPLAAAGNYLQHGAGLAVSGSGSYIINPTFVVDATWGKTSSHQLLFPNLANTRYGSDVLGIPGTNQGPLPWAGGVPQFQIANFTTMGMSYSSLEYFEPVYEYAANATKIKGSHTIRFGADLSYLHPRSIEVQSESFAFGGGVTTLNGGPGANPYNTLSDFLLGQFTEGKVERQNLQPYNSWRTWELALYVRDQWHVSPKLTVNYGLRWEKYPVGRRDAADNDGLNTNGGGIYFFNPQTATVTVCGSSGSGVPADCGIHASNKLFAPSIGIAYRPTKNVVIRAGYSMSPYPFQMAQPQYFSYPGLTQVDLVAVNPYTSAASLSTGIPIIPPPVGANGAFVAPPNTGVLEGYPTTKNFVRGYIESYNFTVQRLLPGQLLGSVGYVGTHAVHLFGEFPINYGQLGGGTASQLLYPFSILGSDDSISALEPYMHDKYNSLQAMLNKRLSRGVTLQFAYTYSKDIGMASSIQIPQYTYYDYATNPLDRTHHFVASGTYELPFGKSKPMANHGVGAAILGGWNVNGIFNHYSGTPFTVTSSGATCNCPGNTQTANQILSNVDLIGSGVGGQPYFNPLAYAPVRTVSFGTSGLYRLRGPGNTNMDMGVARTIRVTERFRVQLRGEALNLSNTPHFANPKANVSNLQLNPDGTVRNLNGFSQTTSTNALGRLLDQRYFRFGLRIMF